MVKQYFHNLESMCVRQWRVSGQHNRDAPCKYFTKCLHNVQSAILLLFWLALWGKNREPWLGWFDQPGWYCPQDTFFSSSFFRHTLLSATANRWASCGDAWQLWCGGHARLPLYQYIPELWFISSLHPRDLHKSAQSLEREKVHVNCMRIWEYGVSEVISRVLIFSIKCHYSMIILQISHIEFRGCVTRAHKRTKMYYA